MAPWQQVLRDTHHEPLGADDAAEMRRAMVETAKRTAAVPRVRRAPVMVIGGLLLSAVTAGLFVASTPPAPVDEAVPTAVAAPHVRQLQFATPGGTRIIWHFDPQFSLKETLP